MNNDDEKKNGKTDFSKFRISANNSGLPVAQKILIHVPVCKPNKQRYVRVNPDNNYKLDCAILSLEDEDRPYLVAPHIINVVAQDMKLVTLQLSIDRQGNVFLWPVPPVPDEGNDNIWNQSQRQIAVLAERKWVRFSSNRAIGCYEPFVAQGEIPEPTWPDLTFEDILEIAFGKTHIIDSPDHPALRKLWGME